MALLLAAIPWSSRSLAEQLSLTLHISAGSTAIISGFIAVLAAKGSALHRRMGIVFVASMLVMGLMGAFVAVTWGRATAVNFPAGMIAAYFVATALSTVREESVLNTRPWAVSLML